MANLFAENNPSLRSNRQEPDTVVLAFVNKNNL